MEQQAAQQETAPRLTCVDRVQALLNICPADGYAGAMTVRELELQTGYKASAVQYALRRLRALGMAYAITPRGEVYQQFGGARLWFRREGEA